MSDRNVVGWFEIPVEDMDRAVKFYNDVLGFNLEQKPFGGSDQMAMFPMDMEADNPGAGGCLYKGKDAVPGSTGTIVYFTSPSGDCANELKNAQAANAEVIMEKTEIPEGHGNFILIKDSEGNRIAIHSMA